VSDDSGIRNTSEGGYEQPVSNDPLSYLQMMASDYQQDAATKSGLEGDQSGIVGPGKVLPGDELLTEVRRPADEDLPLALLEQVQRVRSVYPSSTLELLKYRRTLNDQVVIEMDDGTPLPPPEQLVALSLTTSAVMQGFNEIEAHLLIAAWPSGGPLGDPTM
jgi:hypothetical protein